MKKSYTDVSALLKNLRSDIEDVLSDEVLDEVKNIELRHIEQDVFSVYNPKIYKRRGFGGIDDPANIISEVHDMQLEVYNVTRFNEGYGTYNSGVGLAELVNDGESLKRYFYDYPGSFNQPRPFIDNTIKEIERTNSVENALKSGLKRRGYEVK